MRTLLLIGAYVPALLSFGSPARKSLDSSAPHVAPSQEYAGVYISSPDEDYFTPCGVEHENGGWSLKFRDDEPQAPFLKKVTALRGYASLTHFIRVRGTLGPPGSYNFGFQRRQLSVDSVLEIKESLEPCAGFGVPAGWSRLPPKLRNSKGIAMSGDRNLAAVIGMDGRVTVWSTETGTPIRTLGTVFKGNPSAMTYGPLAFSTDGKLLAVGGSDGVVRVWRPRNGKKIFSLKLKDSAAVAAEMAKIPPRPEYGGWRPPAPPNSYTPARELVFNKRGTMLATTNLFSSIVWSMKTGKKLAEFNIGNDFRRKVFFVGDEGLLMAGDSGRITMRSYLDALPVTRRGTAARWTEHVTMSNDTRTLAVAGGSDSVFLWSVANGAGPVLPVPGFVWAIALSPDGGRVAVAGGGLYVYDTRTGAAISSFHNFPGAITNIWFSADGKLIITSSAFDDRLRLVYIDSSAHGAAEAIDDSLTKQFPLGPPPSTSPRTVGGVVTGPNQRAVPGADVTVFDAAAPNVAAAHATTSPGGYFSFPGITFRHIVIRVRKTGFEPGIKYVHLGPWSNEGPWSIELKATGGEAGRRDAVSPGG